MRRHGGWFNAVLIVASSLVGGLLTLILVVGWGRGLSLAEALNDLFWLGTGSVLDSLGATAAAAAGAMLGALGAILILRRPVRGFDCPYCGARNRLDAVACSTCGERFREGMRGAFGRR